jgi:hypothetical protein
VYGLLPHVKLIDFDLFHHGWIGASVYPVRSKDHRYQGEKRESNSDQKNLTEKLRKDHQPGRKHEAE